MEKHGSNKKHVGVFNSYNNCYLEITQMFVCTEDYVFSNICNIGNKAPCGR